MSRAHPEGDQNSSSGKSRDSDTSSDRSTTSSSNSTNNSTTTPSRLDVQSIGLKVQKKWASRLLSSKTVWRSPVWDENTVALLETLHQLIAETHGDRRLADRVLKKMIKIAVKIGLLIRSGHIAEPPMKAETEAGVNLLTADLTQLSTGDRQAACLWRLRAEIRTLALTVCSYATIDYSYSRSALVGQLSSIKMLTHTLVENFLTERSHERLDLVFSVLCGDTFLDGAFDLDKRSKEAGRLVGVLYKHLNTLIEMDLL